MQQGFWIRNASVHDPRASIELAVAAEEGGWDGVFVSDAVMEGHNEPFTLLAAMAAATETVSLGTWVTPLIARDVVHVARSVANVDQLSGGRVMVGVGIGNAVEHDGLGVSRERMGAHYDAALEVLGALLEGQTVSRHDEWFDLEQVTLNVRPLQDPRPPIFTACASLAEVPMRRAARWEGTMPYWPGLSEGSDDSVAEGARDRELRELVRVYRDAGGDGDILVPRLERLGPEGYDELCRDLGVTWQLSVDPLDVEGVRAGPPS